MRVNRPRVAAIVIGSVAALAMAVGGMAAVTLAAAGNTAAQPAYVTHREQGGAVGEGANRADPIPA